MLVVRPSAIVQMTEGADTLAARVGEDLRFEGRLHRVDGVRNVFVAEGRPV